MASFIVVFGGVAMFLYSMDKLDDKEAFRRIVWERLLVWRGLRVCRRCALIFGSVFFPAETSCGDMKTCVRR